MRVDSLAGAFVVMADGRARVTATWEGLRDDIALLASVHCRGPQVIPTVSATTLVASVSAALYVDPSGTWRRQSHRPGPLIWADGVEQGPELPSEWPHLDPFA